MIDTTILKHKIIDLAMTGALTEHIEPDGIAEEWLKAHNCSFINSVTDSDFPDIPAAWCWTTLKALTDDSTLNDGNWVLSADMVSDGPVKLIQLGSIGDGVYKSKGFKYLTEKHFHELKGRQIFPGFLLINRIVQSRMVSCIIPEIDGILMTAVDVCWLAPQEDLFSLHYIMYALSSSFFQKKVIELGHGVTRFRISKNNLIEIPFPFPPLAEQKRIVEKIESVFSILDTIDTLQAQYSENLSALKAKLVDAAIQGKLTEQLPEDGTAEELYQQIQAEKQALIKAKKLKKEKPLPEISEDDIPFDIPETWKWAYLGSTEKQPQSSGT